MSLDKNLKKILIIDFGSQFTQLIARRIRESGVYSEIISHKKIKNKNIDNSIKGIILISFEILSKFPSSSNLGIIKVKRLIRGALFTLAQKKFLLIFLKS